MVTLLIRLTPARRREIQLATTAERKVTLVAIALPLRRRNHATSVERKVTSHANVPRPVLLMAHLVEIAGAVLPAAATHTVVAVEAHTAEDPTAEVGAEAESATAAVNKVTYRVIVPKPAMVATAAAAMAAVEGTAVVVAVSVVAEVAVVKLATLAAVSVIWLATAPRVASKVAAEVVSVVAEEDRRSATTVVKKVTSPATVPRRRAVSATNASNQATCRLLAPTKQREHRP